LFLFAALWAAEGPVSYYGKFQVSGTFLRSSITGKAMQVKGVSFFWSQWKEGSVFYNENAVDRMAQDWKAEIVRAAYGATGYEFDDSAAVVNRASIETVVEAAIANDIYVIIDWHSHTAHKEAETERAKEFFSYFAEKYGERDNVIFELYNEPFCDEYVKNSNDEFICARTTTWEQIKTYAEAVIPVIREHSSNLILVGTPNYSQKIKQVIGNAIDDPNLGYVLHFYAASHSLNSFSGDIVSVQGAKLPIFVTEFGTTSADGGGGDNYNSHNTARTDEWLAFLNGRNISYVAWSLSCKHEGSAFFGETNCAPFDQTVPENWTNPSFMTASGKYILNMLRSSYEKAPWNPNATNPGPSDPISHIGKANATGLRASGGRVYLDLANGGETRLSAYSLKGAFLKTIFSGHLSTGSHQFALDLPKGAFALRLSQKNDNYTIIVIEK